MSEDVVQPTGQTKKKRGRPPCENIKDKYPYQELVYYEDNTKHTGTGVFLDPNFRADPTIEAHNPDGGIVVHDPDRGKMVAIMSFIKRKNGDLKWAYRPVPNKYGGKPILHHDMVLVSPSNLIPLAKALEKVAVEWFGGQRATDEARIEYQSEKKKEKTDDKITRQLKKFYG